MGPAGTRCLSLPAPHPKHTHRSLTLASFAPTHDLQKIFWGGQNKPAVFFPQRGRIESFGSDFLTYLASKPASKPYRTNQTKQSKHLSCTNREHTFLQFSRRVCE